MYINEKEVYKMKKRLSIVILIVVTISLLAACSSEYNTRSESAINSETVQMGGDMDNVYNKGAVEPMATPRPAEVVYNENADYNNKKVVKTGTATIEVTNYDNAYADLKAIIGDNGYIEESNIWKTPRYVDGEKIMLTNANITVRIKEDMFETFVDELANIGMVTNQWTDKNDVSYTYYDTEARVKLKLDEKARLEQYLTEIDDAKVYFEVQSRITQVIYEIEQLQGNILRLDDQISYSSVNVSINEIAPDEEPTITKPKGFFGKLWLSLVRGVKFLGNAIIFFAGVIPLLIIIAAVVFIIIKLAKRKKKIKK